jgi:hypothetical protein
MAEWNHSICEECWNQDNPGREPFRIRSVSGRELVPRPCCACGKNHGSGIWIRRDPRAMPCQGKGIVHEEVA